MINLNNFSPSASPKNGYNNWSAKILTFHIPSHKSELNPVAVAMGALREENKIKCGLTDFMYERVPFACLITQETMLSINLKV